MRFYLLSSPGLPVIFFSAVFFILHLTHFKKKIFLIIKPQFQTTSICTSNSCASKQSSKHSLSFLLSANSLELSNQSNICFQFI